MDPSKVFYLIDERVYKLENTKSDILVELHMKNPSMDEMKTKLAEMDQIDLEIKVLKDLRLEIDSANLKGNLS